jgi:3',5'-cyclic AMP phosphodiesterase CpdA
LRTILHISDVHFGPRHRPAVAEGVVALAEDRRPDLVVLSGDLTQRAKPKQFVQARTFVDRLPAPVIVVPGNHDVPLYRFWERFLAPYGAYRRHFSPDLEPSFRDEELLVVGINTAHGLTLTEGRIRSSRLREVRDVLDDAGDEVFKVVVPHHQLFPPPDCRARRVMRNAARAVRVLATAGVDLVLAGHHHQTYLGSSEQLHSNHGPPVLFLHAGTATSDRGRGGERGQNSCNWVRIEDQRLVVEHLRWMPEGRRFSARCRAWYPRRTRIPYCLEEPAP